MRLGDLEHAERIDAIGKLREDATYALSEDAGGNSMIDSELTISVGDYRDVEIPTDSIIYCDPPYKNTREYRHNKDVFDMEAFYKFCERQTQPIFISEYDMPEERFFCIAEFDRVSTFSATNNSMRVVEKVFLPNKWKEWWERHKKPELPKQLNIFDYED